MKIFSLFNQKGGVGKTTSAANIGAGLARLGRRVLLIDLDPQANLSASLGFAHYEETENPTVYELMDGKATIPQVIRERDGLHVIPAGLQLASAEIKFNGLPGREMLLKEAMAGIGADYDFIFIDCPPSLGLLTLNALTASDGVLVPIQAEILPLQGTKQLKETAEIVKKRLNPGLEIAGVIVTFYDSRKVLHRQVMERIKEQFGEKLFRATIRANIALAEAPGEMKTIFEYQPDSNGAADYLKLCQEIDTMGARR